MEKAKKISEDNRQNVDRFGVSSNSYWNGV